MIAMLTAALLAMQPPETPTQSDPNYAQAQRDALTALNAADGWRTTPSGLRYRVLIGNGTGQRPTVNDIVRVHYVGRFTSGEEFDSSVSRGEPATFPLRNLIHGWREGIPLMSVGERYEFAVPAELAYGPGRGPIPGGATLMFRVELLAINPPGAAEE